jgi:hypothetical protein
VSAEGGSDDPDAGRREEEPGWAAPTLPPREPAPASGDTAPIGAAAPPRDAWAQPPPPRGWSPSVPGDAPRRRRWWLVVLGLATSVTIVSFVAGTILFIDRTLPPLDAANDFIHDVIDQHQRAATSALCSADRERADRVISDVADTFSESGAKVTVNPFSVDRTDGRATVEYTVAANGSADHTYKLPLRLEHRDWKVCPSAPLG